MPDETEPTGIPDGELERYNQASVIYDQIIALQSNLTTLTSSFLVITGAVWGVVATQKLGLAIEARVLLLLVHLVGCLWILPVVIGIRGAISTRLSLASEIADRAYPNIKKLGENGFHTFYGRSSEKTTLRFRLARWGRQNWFWYAIPLAAAVGSLYLVLLEL